MSSKKNERVLSDEMREMIEEFRSSLKLIKTQLGPVESLGEGLKNGLIKALKDFPDGIDLSSSTFSKNYVSQFEGAAKQIREVFKHFSDNAPELFRELAMQGWYCSMWVPLSTVNKSIQEFRANRFQEGNEMMASEYRLMVDDIEEELCSLFPNRAQIFSKAFKAHRAGDYELSVPTLFAQSDGVFSDCLKLHSESDKAANAFASGKDDRLKAITDFLNLSTHRTVSRHLLLLVAEKDLPFKASERVRSGYRNPLNRHAVLHGEDFSYGSEINGLKAITVIDYAAQFHPESFAFKKSQGPSE